MGVLDKSYRAEIKAVPKKILRQFVKQKLSESNITAAEGQIDQIVTHLLSGSKEGLILDLEGPDIALSFDDDDLQKLKETIEGFIEKLPNLTMEVATSLAGSMYKDFQKIWHSGAAPDPLFIDQFRFNLETRWGAGLEQLRMLLEVSRQFGVSYHRRLQRSKARSDRIKRDLLMRLHARSCQVMAEVITLMENGFADGAMARWRTLHEITMVGTVLADGDDQLCERYLAHDIVEAKKAMDEFCRSHKELGYRPPSAQEKRRVEKEYRAALERFGSSFSEPYGWAAQATRKRKPNFADIEEAAGRAAMRSYYKMASYNVHATSRGLSFRLSVLGANNLVLAGASNAGLEEPGQRTAFSMTHMLCLLFAPPWGLDDIVNMKIILKIRDTASDAFTKAARQLNRDDRSQKRKRMTKGK